MKLKRPLRGSETGVDVRMVQRALNKAPSKTVIVVTGVYDTTTQRRMRAFRAARSLSPGTHFDQAALDTLEPYFDAYGRWRYAGFRVQTKEDIAFEKLLAEMRLLDANSAGYLLGANHGKPLDKCEPDDLYDCSSSCSKVLKAGGMFDGEIAIVSGTFASSWGEPGPGKYFTLYANSEHVWIRLNRNRWNSRWWRFDTSPHADGRPSENPRRGPRLRYLPRFTGGFVARHWEGM